MASGGGRIGAGRKPRGLATKVLDGKSAKFIPMNDFSDVKCDVPQADNFLSKKPIDDGDAFTPELIYTNTYKWLHSVGCDKLVPQELVVKYSWAWARYKYCESHIINEGEVVTCEANGGKMINPYSKYVDMYSKQAESSWLLIYNIVKENATEDFNNLSDDPMEKMLRGRK